jgi:hypothetical protein
MECQREFKEEQEGADKIKIGSEVLKLRRIEKTNMAAETILMCFLSIIGITSSMTLRAFDQLTMFMFLEYNVSGSHFEFS